MSQITDHEIEQACARLSAIAAQAYKRAADGYYDVAMPAMPQPEAAASLSDIYNDHANARTAFSPTLERELKQSGFSSYNYLARGTGASVFTASHQNGHAYAIRFCSQSRIEERVISPLIVQPYRTIMDEPSRMKIEIMPVVQILALSESEIPEHQTAHPLSGDEEFVIETKIQEFIQASHSRSEAPCRDLGILPDGTPIQPDPGQIHYRDRTLYKQPANVFKALATAFANTRSQPVPDQLRWFTSEGTWKQDKFFGNPFQQAPHYRGFTPPNTMPTAYGK